VFLSILQRTIFGELARVFMLSLLGITGILLMAGIVAEATQHGLGPAQVIAVIPLIIPSTLPYTIPATTLFATCVVYGRLSADNEIIAIKAAGIHLFKVVWPGIFLGSIMSAVTMALYYETIPATHHQMRTMFLNDIEELLYSMLKRDRCINQPRLNYVMFVRGVQGRKLQDAVFKRRVVRGKVAPNFPGQYDVILRAKEAELRVDLPRRQILVHMRHCYVLNNEGTENGYFENKVWPVALPADFGVDRKVRPSDLTWDELLEREETLIRDEERLEAQICSLISGQMFWAPEDLPKHLHNLRAIKEHKQQERYGVDAELQMRPALALGCLCFVLIGCPVGIWFSRSDYLSAFITCFLPIVFIYYPILLCATNFAKSGRIDPAVALWSANAVVALVAVGLFRQLLRH
jgi:lipopolysaccharide export system permease protein